MSHRISLSFLTFFENPKVIFILIILIGISQGAGFWYQSYLEKNWETISRAEERALSEYFQKKFDSYLRESTGEVRSILNDPRLLQYLDSDSTASSVLLFELLNQREKKGMMLEVYNASGIIQGWSENRGPVVDTLTFKAHTVSYILRGPIYAYLVISTPIVSENSIKGFLVGKRLFDVQYPINNKFINSNYFTSTFTSTLDFVPAFFASEITPQNQDSSKFLFTLTNTDGKVMVSGLVNRPQLFAGKQEAEQLANRLSGVFGVVLLLMLYRIILRHTERRLRWIWRAVLLTGMIWLLRYILLWLDLPGGFLSDTLFDPTYFASPFGFGLAKSLGDLFLTASLFLINILCIVRLIYNETKSSNSNRAPISFWLWINRIAGVVLLAVLALLLLRGFVATVQSAVFDSSFTYNDPASIAPSFELSVMLVSLFFLSFSLVLAEVGIIILIYGTVVGLVKRGHELRVVGITGFFLLLCGLLYGSFVPNTLLSQFERGIYVTVFLFASSWILYLRQKDKPFLSLSGLSVLLLISICAIVPILDKKIHEYDQTHLELAAHELVRPADNWMNFLMATALDEIGNNTARATLHDGSNEEVGKLGFTQWARSILSKEENDCSVTFIDNEGSVVSDFHIGNTPHWYRRHAMDEMPRSTSLLNAGERLENGKLVKWYRGYKPIYNGDTTFLGGVWVEISGVQRRLQGSAQTEILRNSSSRLSDTRNRRLLTFEYFQGKLVSTTAENVPLDLPLPHDNDPDDDPEKGYWAREEIEGKTYHMYLVPENGENPIWIGVGMADLDVRWHIFSFLRYALFFMLISSIGLAFIFILQRLLGQSTKEGFRTKLLVSFVIVSITPMLVLAYLNRQYAKERADEITIQRLSSQTSVVVAEIEQKVGASLPVLVSQLTDEQCDEIATTMGVDFNVYLNGQLQATSKPEMFMSELLDKSLSGDAYLNTILKRRSFYSETQVIGSLPYVVGYRPIFSESGSVIGAVAVPTLFRQQDVNEELTRRNIFLFGAYALTFVLSLIVGSIFANGIASPIRRLRHATEQIAGGNLEVEIPRSSTDEIGDLERAFQQMTVELRQKQEQIVRAQRELAWKEMARQVAHEIKNPLTPMKLSVQQLLQAYKDNVPDFGDVLKRVSSTVLEQIEALSRIASEFSNFARMPKQNIEQCNVHEVILEAVNLYQSSDLQIATQFEAVPSVVMADREELRRVFINIIKNSVQAMKGTGTMQITTSSAGGFIDINMQDSGPGIPKDVQSRLFEMNFSTKTDGMGIGLSIVHTTVQNLGGTVSVTSKVNQGTMVLIRLPIGDKQTLG